MRNDILGKYIGAWTERDGAVDVKFGGPRGGRSVLFRLEFNDHLPVLALNRRRVGYDAGLGVCCGFV